MPAAAKKTAVKSSKAPTLSPADKLAVAWHTLSKVGAKRGPRDLLTAGSEHRVVLAIEGTVGRGHVSDHLVGTLHVGHDQQRAQSTACDQAELLAAVAGELDKPARDRLFTSLIESYRAHGSLESRADKVLLAECQGLIDQLRDARTTTVRGNVRFVSDEDAASS